MKRSLKRMHPLVFLVSAVTLLAVTASSAVAQLHETRLQLPRPEWPSPQTVPLSVERVFGGLEDNAELDIDGQDDRRVDVDIAIIDTGIDLQNPDLNVFERTDCTAATWPDDAPQQEPAYPFGCNDDSPTAGTDGIDPDNNFWHGSHMAVQSAALDNDIGGVGLAAGARLWAVDVHENYYADPSNPTAGAFDIESAIAGVKWATAHADEIEVAFLAVTCAPGQTDFDPYARCWSGSPSADLVDEFEAAVEESIAAGIVYLTVAGYPHDAGVLTPQRLDDMIVVSALADSDGMPGGQGEDTCGTDDDDTLFSGSSSGADVDMISPACSTSNATSLATGAAAVLATRMPTDDAADVRAIGEVMFGNRDCDATPLDVGAGNCNWTASGGTKEPLLDVDSEQIFDPQWILMDDPPLFESAVGAQGSGNGQFSNPLGVAVGAQGAVWVADSVNNRVQKFDAQGNYVSKFGSSGSGNGQLSQPHAVAVDAQGNVWVADTANNRVQKFDAQGNYVSKFGSSGTGNGQFSLPAGIAFDAQGNIWVTDYANHRVQKFDAQGSYLLKFGSQGSGNGQLQYPFAVEVDAQGTVWVTDSVNNRVQRFDAQGSYLLKFGSSGSGSGQFNGSAGIAFDAQGDIWITDYANHRIQKWAF